MTESDLQPAWNVTRLRRYQRIEIETARLLGEWLPGVERWEVKRDIAAHLCQDAQRSRDLRTRLWELRDPHPDRDPDGQLAAWSGVVRSLATAQHDLEMIAGVYLVLKRQLATTYRDDVRGTHQVQDAPSVSVLERLAVELEEQVAWAEKTVCDLTDSSEKTRGVQRWIQYAEDLIASMGGLDGDCRTAPQVVSPPGYALRLPFPEARRDARFNATLVGMPTLDPTDTLAQVIWQFNNYVQEIQAAEVLGSVLWEADGMDWEFYHDLARHCWDEERHSLLGENQLAKLGHHPSDFQHMVGNYAWRQQVYPDRRYAILTEVIEASSFTYRNRTYQEHIKNGDMASAQAVMYDMIDEIMHVRWGNKWFPRLMEHYGITVSKDEFIEGCRALTAQHSFSSEQRKAVQP